MNVTIIARTQRQNFVLLSMERSNLGHSDNGVIPNPKFRSSSISPELAQPQQITPESAHSRGFNPATPVMAASLSPSVLSRFVRDPLR